MNRSDAEGDKDEDADAGKNQVLGLWGCTPMRANVRSLDPFFAKRSFLRRRALFKADY